MMKRTLLLAVIVGLVLAVGGAQAAILLVGDKAGNQVRKYDSTTGAPLGQLADLAPQGYTNPKEIAVGSDGNLYINVDQGIARYSATSGAYVDVWASTAHHTMTLNPVTNTVYTSGLNATIYQLNAGVESVYRVLSSATPHGKVDHLVQALNMRHDNSVVDAYSDVSAHNVMQSTDGTTDWTEWIFLENTGATGLVETANHGYYNGGGQLRSVNTTKYSYYSYNDGAIVGVLVDGTTSIVGEVNELNGGVHYAAGASEVRVVTSDNGTTATWAPLVNDPTELQQVFGIAYAPESSTPIPEPSTLIIWSLLGALGIGYGWWRRRTR